MKRSNDRILTTHTGSLPRPADLDQMLFDREEGKPVDQAAFEDRVRRVVADIVSAQLGSGVDVVNDGEVGKIGYSTYVKDRLTGFQGEASPLVSKEMIEFPGAIKQILDAPAFQHMKLPACNGPISARNDASVRKDVDNLKAGIQGREPFDVFMSAASPGVIATFLANRYYSTDEEYLFALADAMKPEYDVIAQSGIVLQLDCPDLAMTRVMGANADLTYEQFRDQIRLHVRALNHAVRDIPAEQMRMHLCWGNAALPHIYDIPLKDILDVVLEARPAAISFEAANPRHEHEWKVWEDVKLPDGKVLIPGVLDSCTNYVEHPELVAQRLVRFAQLVGKENVIAGTDCGFGTFAGMYTVDPKVTWLKLHAMADGAKLASDQLW
jgi:5-methyltetrahydropteroyltriglutamate--homocysteine methyltransferase